MQHLPIKNGLLLLLCITLISITAPQRKREEEKAVALLDSAFHYRNFQADFIYSHLLPEGTLKKMLEGTITMQDNQYYLTATDQEIINNGETIWIHFKAAQEVEINHYDPNQENATPWALFTNYRRDYNFQELSSQEVDGHLCDVVVLLAKDKTSPLPQAILSVRKGTSQIKRLEILDHNDIHHVISFTHFKTDLALDPSFFNFSLEQHADVEVIDMR